jgi:hypothetical protein
MSRTIGDWLFSACLIFISGAITSLILTKIGCLVMAGIMVMIMALDNSDKEKIQDLTMDEDPSSD